MNQENYKGSEPQKILPFFKRPEAIAAMIFAIFFLGILFWITSGFFTDIAGNAVSPQESVGDNNPHTIARVIITVTLLAFVVVPAFMFRSVLGQYAMLWRDFKKARRSVLWDKTTGRIVSVEFEKKKDDDSAATYLPHILFAYDVGHESYASERINFNIAPLREAEKDEYLEKYPVDTAMDVFYDPDNPADAVLERGVKTSQIAGLIILPLSIIFLAVFMLISISMVHGFIVQSGG